MPVKPEILKVTPTARSRLFQVEEMELRFSNGVERTYERLSNRGRGAVMVVPLTARNEILLIREYAAGLEDYMLSLPKGLIDPGETPEQAANRVLQEEIGLAARRLVKLKTLKTAPGYFNAQMHIFIAFDLYPSELPGDEPEPLRQISCQWSQTDALLARDDFSEARSVTALFMARQYLSLDN